MSDQLIEIQQLLINIQTLVGTLLLTSIFQSLTMILITVMICLLAACHLKGKT